MRRLSSLAAGIFMLLFTVPAVVCFAQSFERKGDFITYKGNTFEFAERKVPEIHLLTSETRGDQGNVKLNDSLPVKMNGEDIYRTWELTALPRPRQGNVSIQDYLFANLTADLDQLPDGQYGIDINNIVIDTNGKVVFYEGIGLCHTYVSDKVHEAIDTKVKAILNNAPAMEPPMLRGSKVPVLTDILFLAYAITVKNHHTSVKKLWTNEPLPSAY